MKHRTPAASGKHLLIVDDDRLVLATLAAGLANMGYQVSTAESAEDAQALLAGGQRPDLAILDVRMQGQDGLFLARRLHDLDHIPFMMLSAYSDAPTVEQATLNGALGYVVKPADIGQLIPAIEAALARANELQDLRLTRQQLQQALDDERNISMATGIFMREHRLKRSDAFAMLRSAARKDRRKLADVADEVVRASEALAGGGGNPEEPIENPIDLKNLVRAQ